MSERKLDAESFPHEFYYVFITKGTFVPGQSGGLRDKSISFSVRTLPKLLNGAFFTKNFYRKVALKNHINPFLKFKIVNTQLIMC